MIQEKIQNSEYVGLRFSLKSVELQDILLALLSETKLEGIVESEHFSSAFWKRKNFDLSIVESVLKNELFTGEKFEFVGIKNQNWNKVWEKSFKPVVVANRCGIRATFQRALNVEIEIIIDPKMAFGTGHHETTSMMIEEMLNLNFQDKSVLDFGCGTGVLSILASKLGAYRISAIDNDELCFQNCLENCEDNKIENIEIKLGDVFSVSNLSFDVILANINRNTILNSIAVLSESLETRGNLLVSGLLVEDRKLIIEEAGKSNLNLLSENKKGKWIMLKFSK